MNANNLQLVVSESLHGTYQNDQRSWLINLDDFIRIVIDRQSNL